MTLNEKKKSNYHPFYSDSQRGGWCLHKSLWLNYSGESTHILYDRAWRIARPSIPRRPANLGRGRSHRTGAPPSPPPTHTHTPGICCVSSFPLTADREQTELVRRKKKLTAAQNVAAGKFRIRLVRLFLDGILEGSFPRRDGNPRFL